MAESFLPDHAAIPGYEPVRLLGRNGAIIYLARRSGSGEFVALKVYDRGTHLPDARRREELLARLDHPNIVRVLEIGEVEGRAHTALEYVDGSLDKRLRDGPLPVSAAVTVARALVLALQHLRERRIVHINLRPAAILLTNEDVPKLFELEHLESVEHWDEERHMLALMGSGLGFAAPEELALKDRCSANVDVYRVGAILYAMLAGLAPFAGDPRAIMDAVLQQPPAQFSRALGAAEAICLKCLEKRPEHRHISLQALSEDLGRLKA